MNTGISDSPLDHLRTEWAERDRRLDAMLRETTWMLRDARAQSGREKIRRAAGFSHAVELSTGIAAIVLLGAFNASHWMEPDFVFPGVALQIWVTIMFVLGLRQRAALQALDFAQPVAVLQTHVEQLAVKRMHVLKWAFLTGQIVWYVPFMIVLFEGLFGVNLYTVSPDMPRFIGVNLLCGLIAIPVLIWLGNLAKRWQQRWPSLKRLFDTLAGPDIVAARAFASSMENLAETESV